MSLISTGEDFEIADDFLEWFTDQEEKYELIEHDGSIYRVMVLFPEDLLSCDSGDLISSLEDKLEEDNESLRSICGEEEILEFDVYEDDGEIYIEFETDSGV